MQWRSLIGGRDFLLKYSKTCVKPPLSKRRKIGFQDQLCLNAGQRYCRMLQMEHSAILLNFIKLPFVIKIFVLSIFEWLFYTGFTVYWKPINRYFCKQCGPSWNAIDGVILSGYTLFFKIKTIFRDRNAALFGKFEPVTP